MCRLLMVYVVSMLMCLSSPLFAHEQQKHALVMGILPYLSSSELIRVWDPFVRYLERDTGHKIQIASAPDFDTYIKRAATGQYDIYLTAPHFALLAEEKHNYRRIARLKRELYGVIVVGRNSTIKRFADMGGKVLATPDKLAVITMLGEATLKEYGQHSNKDITVKYTPSHNNALLSVIRGTADAAVSSAAVYERLSPSKKKRLRLLGKTQTVPHMMFLAGPSLSDKTYQTISSSILQFPSKAVGKAFFEMSGYGDITQITNHDMQRLHMIMPILDARVSE